VPLYTLRDAAGYLGVRSATFVSWVKRYRPDFAHRPTITGAPLVTSLPAIRTQPADPGPWVLRIAQHGPERLPLHSDDL
jgi:hypothetical protein